MNSKIKLIVLIILIGFVWGIIQFWPDGKIHIVFCDVGQGDAIYIRFPNNADMLIDGGPNNQVLTCLGKYMPFYDRTIDVVALTHPQKDHLQGLIAVLDRYHVRNFLMPPISNSTEGYKQLVANITKNNIPVRFPAREDRLRFKDATMTVYWPDQAFEESHLEKTADATHLLDLPTVANPNDYSLFFLLQWGEEDVLFTGDGDERVDKELARRGLIETFPSQIDLLKVPHHGSKTAMTTEFLDQIKPQASVVQVGKNSFGHPNQNLLDALRTYGRVYRTDQDGVVVAVIDKDHLTITTEK